MFKTRMGPEKPPDHAGSKETGDQRRREAA
jgi:hypothetical protein